MALDPLLSTSLIFAPFATNISTISWISSILLQIHAICNGVLRKIFHEKFFSEAAKKFINEVDKFLQLHPFSFFSLISCLFSAKYFFNISLPLIFFFTLIIRYI